MAGVIERLFVLLGQVRRVRRIVLISIDRCHRDSGVNAIESLMLRRGAFDYILLETTGLADPGNIAPIFWVDDGLGSSVYLDGIVTVVDAKNITYILDKPVSSVGANASNSRIEFIPTMAHMQISHADVVIINKSDLVTNKQLEAVKMRINAINSIATLQVTTFSRVKQIANVLLDIHAYEEADAEQFRKADGCRTHLDPVSPCIMKSYL